MSFSVEGIIPYSNLFVKALDCTFLLLAEEPQNSLFLVSAVASGVDTDSRELTAFAPSFNRQRRDAQYLCDFPDSQ